MLGSILSLAAVSVASAWCRTTTVVPPREYEECRVEGETDPCWTEGVPLAWTRACIPYKVSPRATVDPSTGQTTIPREDPPYARVLELVEESFDVWTEVECDSIPNDLRIERVANETSDYDSWFEEEDLSGMNAIQFVNDWEARDNETDAFALTNVFFDNETGEIFWVNMEINEQFGAWGDCCPAGECSREDAVRCRSLGIVDFRNVVTHEIGHFLGLAHECELPAATMYYTADRGQTNKRTLEVDDREGICSVYPPGSLPDRCDFSPHSPESRTAGCGCRAAGVGSGTPTAYAALGGLGSLLGLFALRRRTQTLFGRGQAPPLPLRR